MEPCWLPCVLLITALVVSAAGLSLLPPRSIAPASASKNDVRYGLTIRRNEVLDMEERIRMGSVPQMTEKEHAVNDLLLTIKDKELDRGFNDSSKFLPSHHFFRVKQQIEESDVFKIIQLLPKGALLHGHNTALVSSDWFVRNITYRPGALMYTTEANVVRFSFRKPANYNWNYIADLRKAAGNAQRFDKQLESYITLYTPTPEMDYPDMDVVWKKFQTIFETLKEAVSFYPVYLDFHYQMLQEMVDDNIMYAEIRTGAGELYDEEDRLYSSVEAIGALQNVLNDFKAKNPRFFGAKVIFTTGRHKDSKSLTEFERYRGIKARFPDFVIGYDIVGQETIFSPNALFAEQIQMLAKENTRFFFHAGETDWLGTPVDNNLIDALLWNTTRIGHGYALMKHPVLWNTVKQRRIAIEICPLSNQVLKLVLDMRNHPATFYISENIPVVISNDDPGFWGATGLSYDFYYAFMSFYPAYSGLEVLKKLVFTSIEYSVLTDMEFRAAQNMLQRQWSEFLDRFLEIYGGGGGKNRFRN